MNALLKLRCRLGSALTITLVFVVLVTVIVVAYFSSVTLETKVAGSVLHQQRAGHLAVMGVDAAVARLREGLGTGAESWDDPYRNFATTPPTFFWSISPGRLTQWDYASTNPRAKIPLFSTNATGTNLVNLNRRLLDGTFPIIGSTNGGASAPELSVKYVEVLRDPTAAASSSNSIVGRYAFWIDDESAKINVNVASGTDPKYPDSVALTSTTKRYGLGVGAPGEIALTVLGVSTSTATNMVKFAREQGFASPAEILRVAGTTTNTYAANVFHLTAASRSPELNVFGQPRVAMMPILGRSWDTDMTTNGLTLLPVREIYPTPEQLPQYQMPQIVNLSGDHTTGAPTVISNPNDLRVNWPLAFRSAMGVYTMGEGGGPWDGNWLYRADNYPYTVGSLLAHYLNGRNSAGQAIRWPAFAGSTAATGYADKYTPRQMDSIVTQIASLGSKAISYDYPFSNFDENPSGYQEHVGRYTAMAPYIYTGWLSRDWVSGMARSPKVSRLFVRATTWAASGGAPSAANTSYVPPGLDLDIWVEYWLPAGYFRGSQNVPISAGEIALSRRNFSAVNIADVSPDGGAGRGPTLASLPADSIGNYWGNQLLRNNQHIDFAANLRRRDGNLIEDKRQDWAALLNPHQVPVDAMTYSGGRYYGSFWGGGGEEENFGTPFFMPKFQEASPGSVDWDNGKLRVAHNRWGGGINRLPMSTSANGGGTLNIEGGLAILAAMKLGNYSDPDPTPLEAWRGGRNSASATRPSWTHNSSLNYEDYQNAADYGTGGDTVEDRVRKAVIPVSLTVPIQPNGGLGSSYTASAWVEDPLVNKFPADWKTGTTTPTGMNTGGAANTMIEGNQSATNPFSTSSSAYGPDPDSYWMPQMDCPVSRWSDLRTRTVIPRSARFPSIGYLQYVRTGIMPDKTLDLVAYENQHGTPFRLLSYAPSGDSAQATAGGQNYPDWAMLDLLYVPSTLAPYGSPYNPSTVNPGSAAAETAVARLAKFGTFGGSTAGRINPNGVVAYTTDVDTPDPAISRRLPLQAVLSGLRVNLQVLGTGTTARLSGPATSTVDADAVAAAIETHIRANGPLRIPGEICNVSAVSALRAPANTTRNDLVRDAIGALTTQSNVFSVWAVGQAVKKVPRNTDYGAFETGDLVQSEVRVHYVVERYLDPGTDGIYGNNTAPGPDGRVGSFDDPMDANAHPFQPRYLYRVLSSEELR
ncbi:MAG: hypothetical protein IAE97_00460 [Chthoniobacterales bacterium]|nr:hypothetical protein [Chthoniobacterales bacterium]